MANLHDESNKPTSISSAVARFRRDSVRVTAACNLIGRFGMATSVAIAFALPVSTTLDRRPARMARVPVQPLLPQHCNKRGQKRDQKARVQQASSDNDLARRVLLGGRNGGDAFGMAEWLRVRRTARRRAADCASGSG